MNNKDEVIRNLQGTLDKNPDMDPIVKSKLERKLKLVKDNNHINKSYV